MSINADTKETISKVNTTVLRRVGGYGIFFLAVHHLIIIPGIFLEIFFALFSVGRALHRHRRGMIGSNPLKLREIFRCPSEKIVFIVHRSGRINSPFRLAVVVVVLFSRFNRFLS